MPCSVGFSSWLPPPSLFNSSSNRNHFYTNCHHCLQPKPFPATIAINPSSKTPNLSAISYPSSYIAIESPFNSTITNFSHTFRIQSSSLSLPEIEEGEGQTQESNSKAKVMQIADKIRAIEEGEGQTQESNSKAKVMQIADKIRAIPVEERCEVLYSLIERQFEPKTIDNFNDMIMGLVVAEELDLALKLFDEMSSLHGLSPNCWTYSILIRCYCKKKQPDEGKRLLYCMIENGFRPNVVTLTILVNSLCSRGKVQRAFEVLEMMEKLGCNPNVQTYNCVLKGFCFVGRIEEAYKMLMGLKRKVGNEEENALIPDIYSYTAVMDGFCKVGRSDEAMELLEEAIRIGLTPDVVTYNALFNGYCIEGKPRKGIQLLKDMKERGCIPDYIGYSTLLHGLLKWGELMEAFWVYNEMVEVGLKVDGRMMNTLLRGLCRESWKEKEVLKIVYHVFDKMKSLQYSVFPDTYNLVIQTFCIGKEVDLGLITLHEMVETGYFPRMVAINRVIRGLCEEEKFSQALSVLVLVCEAGKFPSKISFNSLIDELNRQGNVLGACCIYGAALKLGVVPHRMPLGAQLSRSVSH